MPGNSDLIITDTSCLIILSKVDELELLKLVGKEVFVTPTIEEEFGRALPAWIKVVSPGNVNYQQLIQMDLDRGEASAIALSLEIKNAVLLLDDLKGRRIAERLKLRYSGTFGLILRAKHIGAIHAVKPVLDKIRSTDFRFSDKLIETILLEAGE